MTPTLVSLIGLTLFALGLTWWVYSPRQRSRWDAAAKVLFEENEA